MAKEPSRLKRVGDQIQRELAQLIQREIKDPRVGMVTVTAVQVSREFEHAKVYVTTLGNAGSAEEQLKALNHAAGFLRKELGRRMQLRTVPQLHFLYDTSIERGRHLRELIESAVKSDEERHK